MTTKLHPLTREDLLSIWMEVLGVDVFDAEQDFFQAGGDSLKATTMMAAILGRYGLMIEELDVFWTPRFDDFFLLVQSIEASDAYK